MLDLWGEVLSGGCKSGFGGRGQLKFFSAGRRSDLSDKINNFSTYIVSEEPSE